MSLLQAALNALKVWQGATALILVILAVCMAFFRASQRREAALMAATSTTPAGQVGALPLGTLVEVKGALECAQPVKAEFSQQDCAYAKSEIIREEVEYYRDSDDKRQRRTSNTTIHSKVQTAACAVRDDSGAVPLRFDNATIEGVEVVNRVEGGPSLGADLAGSVVGIGRDSTSLRHRETVLPAGAPVYVLGHVQPDGAVGAAVKGARHKTFVVSLKSKEERMASLSWSMTTTLSLIGAPLVIAGLLAWWALAITR